MLRIFDGRPVSGSAEDGRLFPFLACLPMCMHAYGKTNTVMGHHVASLVAAA